MAITKDYFYSNIMIPYTGNSNLDAPLDEAILRYEQEILKSLLGYTLWKEYTTGIAEVTPDQKWKDLRDGAEFSFELNGYTIETKWEGFENARKISLVAYYIYYQYRKYGETQFTGTGEKSQVSENSTDADFQNKMIWIQNEMVRLYGVTPNYLIRRGIGQYFRNLDNYVHYNDEPSAFNFLLANKDTYTSWVFSPIRKDTYLGF